MYQPAHLDSFLRLLISHLGSVLTQGEGVKESQSTQTRMDLLQNAIEQGDSGHAFQKQIDQIHDSEGLFVLQMSQSREWVDRLGQLDRDVERDTDEFLAATFSIESLMQDYGTLETGLNGQGGDSVSRSDFGANIDIDGMMCAIFELLGRLEDRYDLMEELLEVRQVANGVPFGPINSGNQSAKIIPMFSKVKKALQQNN